jgi:hypothetical protein
MNLQLTLEPLLHGDPARWKGLPPVSLADFDATFGSAAETEEGVLGHHPATRRIYRTANAGAGLILWDRKGVAVMVEALAVPPASVLAELPEPSLILAQEILVPGAYAHEFLYCATGLVLTVARALRHDAADRIVRCRGLKPLASPAEFGPDYFREFDDQVRWLDTETFGPRDDAEIRRTAELSPKPKGDTSS